MESASLLRIVCGAVGPTVCVDAEWLVMPVDISGISASDLSRTEVKVENCGRERENNRTNRHVGLRLSKSAFSPSCIRCIDIVYIPPFSMNTGILFSRKNFCTASAVKVSFVPVSLVEFGHKSCILTWTYQVFRIDELKVVIMCNGYGVLSAVVETFLLVPAEYNQSERSSPS